MKAGSRGAIQGANSAKITKTMTSTTPIAASGLWHAFPTTKRRNEMAAVDKRVVEFYSLIILRDIESEASHMGASPVSGVYPPRHTLEVLLGAGFAKQPVQNLECKRLRSQNPDNKGLALINFGN